MVYFPSVKRLSISENSNFYAINNLEEATDYLAHSVLGKHLIEISETLLHIKGKSATEIFGNPDDLKLRSSMTLFANVADSNAIFEQVLQNYFHGLQDEYTLKILHKNEISNETV